MRTRLLLAATLLLGAAAPHPTAAQSPWSLSGGIGLARTGDALDGPALGGLGARTRIVRETLIGFGIELSVQSLGESAAQSICLDPDCTRFDYVGTFESTVFEAAGVLRLGGRPSSPWPYLLATLGYVSLRDRRELPQEPAREQTATGIGASAGIGLLPIRLAPTTQLGLEARLHGLAVGEGESGGIGGFFTITGVVRFGFGDR